MAKAQSRDSIATFSVMILIAIYKRLVYDNEIYETNTKMHHSRVFFGFKYHLAQDDLIGSINQKKKKGNHVCLTKNVLMHKIMNE